MIGSWLVIFVSLIVLNVAFHGTLVNDFKIPGSDVQKATDLINAKFGGAEGRAAARGDGGPGGREPADSGRRPGRDRQDAGRQQAVARRSLDTDKSDVSAITDPLAPAGAHQLAKDGRIAYFDVQFDQTGFELPRSDVVDLEDQLRAIGAPAGLQVAVHRRRREARPPRA